MEVLLFLFCYVKEYNFLREYINTHSHTRLIIVRVFVPICNILLREYPDLWFWKSGDPEFI